MTFAHAETNEFGIKIRVLGIGGGGNNAVNRMITENLQGVEFVAVNTDQQALKKSVAANKIAIGEKITNGFGAGANVEIGKRAAEEAASDIKSALVGADLVFITAGMGGGTGTGAAPIVAKIAQEMGILTVGVVTTPFGFEGKLKMERARSGIEELGQFVDSLVVIPNERLKMVSDTRITLINAFSQADEILLRGVQSISDLINKAGFINIDFADIRSVLENSGVAYMGVGRANGKDKAQTAATMAISSPLIETSIKGAKGVIVSISASVNVGLEDVDLACTMITNECNPNASVIWGVNFDETLDDEMKITLIAAGFDKEGDVAEDKAEEAVEEKKDDFDDIFSGIFN